MLEDGLWLVNAKILFQQELARIVYVFSSPPWGCSATGSEAW
jgi:hypothetical protein